MGWIMRLTHNSLATMIAWVSTCLLAGGVSTLFNDSTRGLWMIWGCFGLAAALGLDVVARVRERMRMVELNQIAISRFDRDMTYALDENAANEAIREATVRILGCAPSLPEIPGSRRTRERVPCNLGVELLLNPSVTAAADHPESRTCAARITNLSDVGFELTLAEPLSRQRMTMSVLAANGGRQTMLGEVLWCSSQADGSFIAGGRFLDVGPFQKV
jgi:hypothetical protein